MIICSSRKYLLDIWYTSFYGDIDNDNTCTNIYFSYCSEEDKETIDNTQ